MAAPAVAPMFADTTMEFPYKHSTGDTIGRFLAGLKEQRRIWGQRVPGQGVVVPPVGYSETSGADGGEWVAVADQGTVTAVAVVHDAVEGLHPAPAPFAYVLVRLDGADTALLHIVTEGLQHLRVGARVHALWRRSDERIGSIKDIACFLPLDLTNEPATEPPAEAEKYIDTNVHLPYHYVAGDYRARYLRALKDKKILGSKDSKTGKVFVMPIINSPESFAPCDELVEVADRGIVTTFCIVNIPVIGRSLEIPYVAASVALDGADISIFALVQECKAEDARMGMRVEAVWKPDGERQGDHEDILYFRPTGEPDAPLESFIHRL